MPNDRTTRSKAAGALEHPGLAAAFGAVRAGATRTARETPAIPERSMTARILTTGPVLASLAALALLSACGGGSGGDSPPPGPETAARTDAFTADAGQAVDAGQAGAESPPQFGSVYQTGREGRVADVTAVDTTRRPDGTIDIVVRRADGSATSLNTDTHLVDRETVRSPTGRTAVSGTLLDFDRTSITAAAGLLDADPDDLGDWLVGGYWLHIEGDWANGGLTGAEAGAFVDGPELVDNTVPTGGTATYRGLAGGLYAYRAGTDDPVPEGTHELGDYSGVFTATADFAARTVSGEISDIRLVGIAETPDGGIIPIDETAPARLILLPAPIDAATGRLTGRVTVVSPDDPVRRQAGHWGGHLSDRDDGAGNPRALAGTHGGSATTQGGAEVAYIGTHFGTTGPFE